MKEAIAELRSTIGRLRPHLIHDHHPSSAATTTQQQSQSYGVTDAGTADATTNDNDNPNEESSVINELQLEAATELVNAISSFVWNLDCLWEETSSLAEKEGCDDNMQAVVHENGARRVDGEQQINGSSNKITTNGGRTAQQQKNVNGREPHTEWNEEAKSLIREGYGLIATASSSNTSSSFVDDDGSSYQQHTHNPQQNQNQQIQQQEAMRTIVRSSILDLLPSVSTSACRHFLLAFLPHFMPLALLKRKEGGDDGSCVPLWLTSNDNTEDNEKEANLQMQGQCHNDSLQSTDVLEKMSGYSKARLRSFRETKE